MSSNLKLVLFDYNGTLLDDTHLSVEANNYACLAYYRPAISFEMYRAWYQMPVATFMARAGVQISEQDRQEIADRFYWYYDTYFSLARLFPGVEEMLGNLRSRGIRSAILSSHLQDGLEKELNHFGLTEHFVAISGSEGRYPLPKIERGRELLQRFGVSPDDVLMVGDTCADAEVARELGTKCILIPNGSQSESRVRALGYPVIDNITDLIETLPKIALAP